MVTEGHLWKQRDFNQHLVGSYDELTDADKVALTKDYVLKMVGECYDLLGCFDWKGHRAGSTKNIIRSNVVEELVDVYKYLLSILVVFDITAKEFDEAFYVKSAVVFQRWKQEFERPPPDVGVAAIDIDGVLADYPKSFCDFMERETGVNLGLTVANLQSLDLYQAYGKVIGFGRMLELKDKYRGSGEKQSIPVVGDAGVFLSSLRSAGLYVVLLTARPMELYKRMFGDTMIWLMKNQLVFDAIVADEHKNIRVYHQFPNLRFMVEDSFVAATAVADLGAKVYLLDRPYNQGDGAFIRVNDFAHILRMEGVPCVPLLR